MSKLDEILGLPQEVPTEGTGGNNRAELEAGNETIRRHNAKKKQQIKDLFLEIVGTAENIFQSRDELITRKQRFDELRRKIEEL